MAQLPLWGGGSGIQGIRNRHIVSYAMIADRHYKACMQYEWKRNVQPRSQTIYVVVSRRKGTLGFVAPFNRLTDYLYFLEKGRFEELVIFRAEAKK